METRNAIALTIEAPHQDRFEPILSVEALGFLEELVRRFAPPIREALERRSQRLERVAKGEPIDFLTETESIRAGDWKVAPLPHDLIRRTVEITGPTDRKMVINALNSGADVFMADFEDANSPTWENLIEGQLNLRDAVRRRLAFDDPATGKQYRLN
ncbi:MAG TPA: malate synthase A, partial [Methylomirabilota bacterium]|nr:malate synthase A [Methylomirabilota bacterium]